MSLAVFFSALIALLVCLNPSLTLAQDEVDEGSHDEVILFLNALSNAKSNVENSAAALAARETLVVSKTRVGLMAKDDGARELYAIGRAHWDNCQYDDELRILEMAIDLDPTSFAAAKSLSALARLARRLANSPDFIFGGLPSKT